MQNNKLQIIIFSRDRAAQLDMLIGSIYRNVRGFERISILYTYSAPEYKETYGRVEDTHQYLYWIKQDNFKTDFLSIIKDYRYAMVLCDDDYFVSPFNWDKDQYAKRYRSNAAGCLAMSLRLHPNLNFCFAYNSKMARPELKNMCYRWNNAPGDWGYPISLDGNIYEVPYIWEKLKDREYNNPNQLEGNLGLHKFDRPMIQITDRPIVVGIPFNRVQDVCQNRTIEPETDPEALTARRFNQLFYSGKRLSVKLSKSELKACHVETVPIWL